MKTPKNVNEKSQNTCANFKDNFFNLIKFICIWQEKSQKEEAKFEMEFKELFIIYYCILSH